MAKKDLTNLQTDLSALAGAMPSQHVARQPEPVPAAVTPKKKTAFPVVEEETTQYSFALRKTLRKELATLAIENDMTMRAFVLKALKAKGLTVTKEDLLDMRKGK
jgi:hypothetical protein